jgi:hypothetical protein
MRERLGFGAAVASIVLGGVVGFMANSAAANNSFDRGGIAVQVPSGWSLTLRRINGVLDPVTVFTVSTFRLVKGGTSTGDICSRPLRRAWRSDGGYVQLTEERDGASRKRMLRRVPLRPRHFHLNATGAGGLCTPPDSGELSFQAHGRAFYVFYGFGRKAPNRVRVQAVAMLDAMRISQRR